MRRGEEGEGQGRGGGGREGRRGKAEEGRGGEARGREEEEGFLPSSTLSSFLFPPMITVIPPSSREPDPLPKK